MVWELITGHGSGKILILNGYVNASKYKEILQNDLAP